MRWIIDRTLLINKNNQGSREKKLQESGFAVERAEPAWIGYDEGFLWNAIRYWSQYFILTEEGTTSWAYSWRDYVCRFPNVVFGDWDEWDALITVFIRNLYLSFWNSQLSRNNSKDVRRKFWNSLWVFYAKTQGFDVEPTLERVQSVIDEIVQNEPFDLSVLGQTDLVLEKMCAVSEIQWEGVSHPGWANFIQFTHAPVWEEPEMSLDWDIPLVLYEMATGIGMSAEMILSFLTQNMDDIVKHLTAIIHQVHSRPSDLYEFWFPLLNHALLSDSEVEMDSNTKLVGISETLAQTLTNASGIGPRPPVRRGDAFVVVSCYGKTSTRAREDALRELGHIQTMLRVADAGFRWEVSFYYFITMDLSNRGLPKDHFFMAERRDNRQVYPELTDEWLTKYRDWLAKIEDKPGEVAESLLVAMKWQGLSRVQDGAESEFLCLWIVLERLGNGSYHYKKTIPHVAGTLWNWSMWSSLSNYERLRGNYQDRRLMERIIGELGNLRSREVAHRGQFTGKKDVRYATYILKHLVNDLIRWTIALLMERDDIRSFDDLTQYIDQSMQLV
ncbi:hypothetical protein [Ferroacidibacillus organovorans]|nr:hypothetical protein [Ferroacidibacillus organovorans]